MRLPAVTPGQKRCELARAFSEQLYAAFKSGQRVTVLVDARDYVRRREALAANQRHFWAQRGFRLRTSVHPGKDTVSVWLEQGLGPKRRKPGTADRANAWAQRADWIGL